jgi:hypothetical protein
MSCCGQKRNALKQSRPAAPRPASPEPAAPKATKLASLPGQLAGEKGRAALLAFLARKGRPPRS